MRVWNLINPATGEILRRLPPTAQEELHRLLPRIRTAQQRWREVPLHERLDVVEQFTKRFRTIAAAAALDVTHQMGKPVAQALSEVDRMLERAATMMRLAPAALQDEELSPKEGFRRFIRHEPLMPVDTDAAAIRLMNSSSYALPASIWTEDIVCAEGLAHELAVGTVFVNRCDFLDPELPWVGIRDSGHGCTLSHLGFRHLTRPKSFHLRTQTFQ